MFMAQSTKRFSQYMDSNSTVYQIVLMNLVNKLISVKPEKHSILELCWVMSLLYVQRIVNFIQCRRTRSAEACGSSKPHSVVAFFLACKDFGRMFDHLLPICTFFFFFRLLTLIPLFRPGSVHSGSASWDDCGWAFPDELCVSLFPWEVQFWLSYFLTLQFP